MIRRVAIIVAFLLGLGACGDDTGPTPLVRVEPSAVTDAAAARVTACGAQHGFPVKRPYETLRFWADASADGGEAPGYDIILRPDLWAVEKMVAHEMVHAMLNVKGHPPIFAACGLAMSQF